MNNSDQQQYAHLIELKDDDISMEDIEQIVHDPGKLTSLLKQFGDSVYSKILLNLTHEKFNPKEAFKLWQDIQRHLQFLTDKLNRNPGIAVATLDYMSNIRHSLNNPVLIEENKSDFVSEKTTIDALTGLLLRSVFDIEIAHEFNKSIRSGSSLCLLMIDIDDFKKVNDNHGHQLGDQVLQLVAQTIIESIRDMDLATRYGGEEIAIIMPQATIKNAEQLAERIRSNIANLHFQQISITVSIGISDNLKQNSSPEKMIKQADKALYNAKESGKNKVITYQ